MARYTISGSLRLARRRRVAVGAAGQGRCNGTVTNPHSTYSANLMLVLFEIRIAAGRGGSIPVPIPPA